LAEALADSYGFDCQFFWQPVVYTKQNPTGFESSLTESGGDYRDFTRAVYQQVQSSEALAPNSRFHYVGSVFDDVRDQCYLDFAHLSEEANEIVAREILGHVMPVVRRRISNGNEGQVSAPRVTGEGAAMNTSFNLKGDAIVESPRDAVQRLYTSGPEVLVIGSFHVSKSSASK
jgi:hypothetical protein